jgi:hypothetical protein
MGIVTADQSKKGLAGLRGNQIIVGADDVKHGTGDLLQVDRLTTDNQAVAGEEVALQDLVGQLTGYLTGQGNVTDEPSREPARRSCTCIKRIIPEPEKPVRYRLLHRPQRRTSGGR